MKSLLAQHAEKFRFALVGGFNTALDFGILFGLTALGIDTLVANFISTTVAFCFSFFANRTFTFKATGSARREFILFTLVTLFGLWVLQPIIISLVTQLIGSSTGSGLLLAKLAATIVSLIWNYILYSKLVFQKRGA